jgi:hypothetical protein
MFLVHGAGKNLQHEAISLPMHGVVVLHPKHRKGYRFLSPLLFDEKKAPCFSF